MLTFGVKLTSLFKTGLLLPLSLFTNRCSCGGYLTFFNLPRPAATATTTTATA